MLECAKENLEQRKIEKLLASDYVDSAITHPDEEERELRNYWEKTCYQPVCTDKFCCLNVRTLRKISYAACILRPGSRCYGSSLQIQHLSWAVRLINILEEAIILIKNPVPIPGSPPKNNLVMLAV